MWRTVHASAIIKGRNTCMKNRSPEEDTSYVFYMQPVVGFLLSYKRGDPGQKKGTASPQNRLRADA